MSKRRESKGAGPSGEEARRRRVVVLKRSKDEGKKILSNLQYACVVEVVKRIGDFDDHEEAWDLDIRRFGDFYELRMKGSFLGKINLRVYFAYLKDRDEVLVLKTYKKEQEDQTPPYIMETLKDRCEQYISGGLRVGLSVHQKRESP